MNVESKGVTYKTKADGKTTQNCEAIEKHLQKYMEKGLVGYKKISILVYMLSAGKQTAIIWINELKNKGRLFPIDGVDAETEEEIYNFYRNVIENCYKTPKSILDAYFRIKERD